MKSLYTLLIVFYLTLPGFGQIIPFNKVAVIDLPSGSELLSPEVFPLVPSTDDFPVYSRKFANGDYYKIGSNYLQITAYEKGLSQTHLKDWVNGTKIVADKDSKTYSLADLRIINKNTVMRLANEGHPRWGSLNITVQNPLNTKRIHLNFKYVKSDRIKINELAERIIQSVKFK